MVNFRHHLNFCKLAEADQLRESVSKCWTLEAKLIGYFLFTGRSRRVGFAQLPCEAKVALCGQQDQFFRCRDHGLDSVIARHYEALAEFLFAFILVTKLKF